MRELCGRALRAFALVCMAWSCAACLLERPPRDFDPVPPETPTQPPDHCPDLTGLTLDLAGSTLASTIFERQAPKSHGLPRVLVFRRGPTWQEGWWVVPRAALLGFARDLREQDSARYSRWRELVLRRKLPDGQPGDFDRWLTVVTELGPPGPVYAGMVSRGCKDHWTRAWAQGLRYRDDTKYTDREIWLARDRTGDLLVKDVTLRLKSYGGWGGNVNFVTTGASYTWSRVRPVEPASAEMLTEEELPAIEVPAELAPSCRAAPDRMVEFTQRLASALPPGTSLAEFHPQPPSDGQARECAWLLIELTVEGATTEALEGVDDILRRDPDVRGVELLAPPPTGRLPRRRLRLQLR